MGTSCCASCGVAEIDDIKLMDCDGCDLVRYCSEACRELHRPEHAGKCKERAVELREELLFKQPESRHDGDCPICSLPMPLDAERFISYECCSKLICKGCVSTILLRDGCSKDIPCPFCRTVFRTQKEADKLRTKRAEANDPAALCQEGIRQYQKGKYSKAFKCFAKAAELGDAEAQLKLACLYRDGEGVQKDVGKMIYHAEEAAIAGHPLARYLLGEHEYNNYNLVRAVKHFIIAAKQGHDASMKALMEAFKDGFISKEELAATLRAQKAAVDATKSPQRELEQTISSASPKNRSGRR